MNKNFSLTVLETAKFKIKALASGEGLCTVSSHGERQKGRNGGRKRDKKRPNPSFYREPTREILVIIHS